MKSTKSTKSFAKGFLLFGFVLLVACNTVQHHVVPPQAFTITAWDATPRVTEAGCNQATSDFFSEGDATVRTLCDDRFAHRAITNKIMRALRNEHFRDRQYFLAKGLIFMSVDKDFRETIYTVSDLRFEPEHTGHEQEDQLAFVNELVVITNNLMLDDSVVFFEIVIHATGEGRLKPAANETYQYTVRYRTTTGDVFDISLSANENGDLQKSEVQQIQ